jgi:hypothetical protein
MLDPSTILAVIDLSAKVLSCIWKYFAAVKDARNDIGRLRLGLEDLQRTFQNLGDLLNGPNGSKLAASKSLVQATFTARKDVEDLLKSLDPGKRTRLMKLAGLRELGWPLKKDEVAKILARFERYKAEANLALQVDQMYCYMFSKQFHILIAAEHTCTASTRALSN